MKNLFSLKTKKMSSYMKSDLGIFINVTIGFVKSCPSFSEADKAFMLHNLERIKLEAEMICEKNYTRKYQKKLENVGSRAKFFYNTEHSFDCENSFDLDTLFHMIEKIEEEFKFSWNECEMTEDDFITNQDSKDELENSLYEDSRAEQFLDDSDEETSDDE